jgi:hypothetical protein
MLEVRRVAEGDHLGFEVVVKGETHAGTVRRGGLLPARPRTEGATARKDSEFEFGIILLLAQI